MEGGQRLKVTVQLEESDKRLAFVEALLDQLLASLH